MIQTPIRSVVTYTIFILLSCCKNLVAEFGVDGQHRRAITNGRVVVDPSDAQFVAKSGRDDDEETSDYLCGATLIHNDILLTAAHCQGSFNYGVLLYDPETNDYTQEATVDLQVRFPGTSSKKITGAAEEIRNYNQTSYLIEFRKQCNQQKLNRLQWSRHSQRCLGTYVRRDGHKCWHHPSFKLTPLIVLKFRILQLLRLSTDPGLPIAKMNSDNSMPSKHDIMRAYGFGKISSNGPPSKRVREGYLKYIDNGECSKRIWPSGDTSIWDDVMCGDPYLDNGDDIEEGSSICQGDSGGPLLDSSDMLLGVISWNFLCLSDELPDGFARVSYFHDWITEQICFHSRKPFASNNECPNGTSPPPPAPGSVQVLLTFYHDFYPEETFFRILSKDRFDEVEYAGPKYVPGRESAWTTVVYLLPVRVCI